MVTLKTNDPQRPIVYLTIRGTVPQDVEVTPQSLTLAAEKGQSIQKNVEVVGPPGMDITEVRVDNPLLKVTHESAATDEAGKTWRIQVSRTKDAPAGEFKSTLTIKTTHADRPIITIPITSVVRGDLQVTPPSAFFGFVKNGGTRRIDLVIQSRAGTPFKITAVKVNSDEPASLHIKGDTDRRSAQHQLTLERDSEHARFIDSQLKIETDVAGEEILTIPITALVEKSADSKR